TEVTAPIPAGHSVARRGRSVADPPVNTMNATETPVTVPATLVGYITSRSTTARDRLPLKGPGRGQSITWRNDGNVATQSNRSRRTGRTGAEEGSHALALHHGHRRGLRRRRHRAHRP